MSSAFHVRLATQADIPALHALIESSVRILQANDYTPGQIEGALGTVLGLDTQLVTDQTYFVAETAGNSGARTIVACGGWSNAKPSSAATTPPSANPNFSIPLPTPPKSAPFSSTPIGPAAASALCSLKPAKTPPSPPASPNSKWVPPSPASLSTNSAATRSSNPSASLSVTAKPSL